MTGPDPAPTLLRYDRTALLADHLRGGVGLALTALPLLLVTMHPVVGAIFLGAALLFAAFLIRTAIRQRTLFRLSGDGLVASGPMGTRRIAWADLAELRLRYFATRRDRQRGWMQLRLAGPGGRIGIESSLDGFEAVVAAAQAAARARGLRLDDATEANLLAIGARTPDTGLAARWGLAPPTDGPPMDDPPADAPPPGDRPDR